MKNRIFQNVFLACMAVFLVGSGCILAVLFRHRPGATLLDLFTPLLAVLVLVIVLSLGLAFWLAKIIVEPLNRIDVQNPDERYIYEELHPLVQRISGQNRQLQQKVDELKVEHARQDAMRREFTANVSHELKTPLQSIIGSAELMENGIVKEEDVPRFIGHIRKEASRLVFLIDDIIRLSELDEGAEMPHEDVSLKVLSEEVCETLADAAKLKDVSLEVTGDDGVINGVRRLLYEIVYNLCDNAIKYNNPGGSVKVTVAQKPGEVLLSVQDTDIGIAPEHQDKVFERFYRVDKSHFKQSGGTGLGLSIVKHAVQYHHGKLSVKSELNKGTTISILFGTGR